MISRIHIQNFKSLRDASVDLRLRNALVGPNMAGKSNLLDALRFLTYMIVPAPGVNGLASAINQFGGFSELTWKGGDSNLISLSLEGNVVLNPPSTDPVPWSYEISILGDPMGHTVVQNESLRVTNAGKEFDLIRKNPQGQRVLYNLDGRLLSHINFTDRSALEFEMPDWEGNQIRRFFNSWRFYRLIPGLMKQANTTAAATFLNQAGDNLSSWLMMLQTRYPESFRLINSSARDVLSDFDKLFTWPTQQSTVFLASNEKHLKRPVAVWHMSDGELVFIALLSLIFCPLDLAGGLYCIEEPEAHLHPRLLETLVQLLKQVQETLGSQASQILVTTHSPYLVDKLDIEELIVVQKHEGSTVLVRPAAKRHLRELLSKEEVGLGDLYYSGALGSAE